MEYPHIVEVNLVGMTGIIVDRLQCKDVLTDPSSALRGVPPPCPPQDMKVIAVVQQPGGHGSDAGVSPTPRYGVSAVSSPLQRSAGKEGIAGRVSGKQRYLALWDGAAATSRSGGAPSLVFETDLPRKGSTNGVDDKYTFSKKFDVHLLMLDSETREMIPVGRALLTLRPGMNGSQHQNLVVHPMHGDGVETDSLPAGDGSKSVYSVDPSARLRVQVSVTERDGNSRLRGSSIPSSGIPRVASKPVYSIEAIRMHNGKAPILVEDGYAGTRLNANNGDCIFHEEKKEDNEMFHAFSSSEAYDCNESFEVQEDEAIVICGAKESVSATVDKALASPRRPPKPPSAKKSPKHVPVPPPPRTPPPKLRSSKTTGAPSPVARTKAAASSTPDSASVSSSSETLPFSNTNASPGTPNSNQDLESIETESKASTRSKASGSSAEGAAAALKPQLTTLPASPNDRKKHSKFQLQRRLIEPLSTAQESLSPEEMNQAGVDQLAVNAIVESLSNAQPVDIPVASDRKDDLVREAPVPPIWTEQWTDDGDETTTRYTFRSDDDGGTFDTRQTSTTYDYSQWGSAEKLMAMIPWAKIDSIIDRTKIDALIDKIPTETLSRLAAFASPAEFDEETCDNTSRFHDSVTDEGSFTTYRRHGSYDDDDTFIERHASLFKAAGCWIPTVPASMRRAEPLVRRSSRFEPKFDLPEHFSAVAAAGDESTVGGASIAPASVSERKAAPGKEAAIHESHAAEPEDLNSLAPSSVNADGASSLFKSRKPPFKKPVEARDATVVRAKSSGPVAPEKLQSKETVHTSASEMMHPSDVTSNRLEKSESSSPFVLTDASPIAVNDFPPTLPQATPIASITDLFQRKDKVDDESLIDAPSQPEIYVVVDDAASLGDLTMTTHELLLESAAGRRATIPASEPSGSPHGRKDDTKSAILSFFTCGTSDAMCSASPAPPIWTRAKGAPSPGAEPLPHPTQGSPARSMGPNDEYCDETLQGASSAVPDEMRAAAEAAWAKRSAEIKRARPSWRKTVGYEI